LVAPVIPEHTRAADNISVRVTGDFHAPTRGGDEPGEHFIAARVILPDVKLDMHVMLRFVDALSERDEKLTAVNQQSGVIGAGNGILIEVSD
jgi:hypothetical protein